MSFNRIVLDQCMRLSIHSTAVKKRSVGSAAVPDGTHKNGEDVYDIAPRHISRECLQTVAVKTVPEFADKAQQ